MVIRRTLCAILSATVALAGWKRYVHMPHGNWTDSPPAHGMSYFQVDPCLRSNTNDRLLQCDTRPSAIEIERRLKTRTKLRFVGKIGQLRIYDLEYFFTGSDPGLGMRSVLVKTGLNRFHEIHVQGNQPFGTLFPSVILHAGRQPVTKVKFDDGGIYHGVSEDYFLISDSGAVLLDFAPVFKAADQAIPSDMVTYQPTSRYDFKAFIFHIQTEKRHPSIGPKVACCEGRVEVPFQIVQSRIVAGKAKYFP